MLTSIILMVIILIALYTDLKERRIPNYLVFTGMILGLGINFINGNLEGLVFSLKGLGLGVGLFFLPFLLGGLGAGDVKLAGAIGALKGPEFVITALLATGVAGGVIALFILIKQKRLIQSLKRIGRALYIFSGTRKINTLKTLDQAELHESFPYGLAIAIGTVAALLMR